MKRLWLAAAALLLLSAPHAAAGAAKRLTLPNGMRVIVSPTWSTEVVAIELLLDVSALDEPSGKTGIRSLVQRLLLRGTKRQSGDSMARQLAAVGGVMDATVGLDYVELYALVPADGFETAMAVLGDAVRNPSFLPQETQSQTAVARQAARAAREDPFQETYLAFRAALYGDHPYAAPTFGTPRSLASISRQDITTFHARHYLPNSAVLAVCGGVGEVRATRAARKVFGGWIPQPPPSRPEPEPLPLAASVVAARELPVKQTHLILGFLAPAAGQQDYYAMQVIDSLLSGGASSRLPQRLREELGLVYHASSFYPTLYGRSHLVTYAATSPGNLSMVKAAAVRALARLTEQPVPADELGHAKRYLLGTYALSHQRMKDQAYALAWYELLGLGCDFAAHYEAGIEAVTASDVQRAAQAAFTRFALAVTVPRT